MHASRIFARLHTVEIAIAIATLITAFWQLILIDRTMVGFVACWMVAPCLALGLRLLYPARTAAALWAAIYLSLMAVGAWLLPSESVLPNFNALHRGSTEFAERWNHLDRTSRRVISWNMALTGTSLFWFLGYAVFWRELREHKRTGNSQLSPLTCYAGLFVVWFLPGLAAVSMALSIL